MRKSVIVGCCLLAASCFLSAQQKKYLDHLSDYIENIGLWMESRGGTGVSYTREAYFPKRGLEILL